MGAVEAMKVQKTGREDGGEGERPCVGIRGRNRATIMEEEGTALQTKFKYTAKSQRGGSLARSCAKFRGSEDTEGEEV